MQILLVKAQFAVEQIRSGHLVDEEDVRVLVGGHRLQRRGEERSHGLVLAQFVLECPQQVGELDAALDVQGDLLDAGGDALGVLLCEPEPLVLGQDC